MKRVRGAVLRKRRQRRRARCVRFARAWGEGGRAGGEGKRGAEEGGEKRWRRTRRSSEGRTRGADILERKRAARERAHRAKRSGVILQSVALKAARESVKKQVAAMSE